MKLTIMSVADEVDVNGSDTPGAELKSEPIFERQGCKITA
jgi:hypothetical protein